MPFKSGKQKRFMEGIAHGMKPYAKDAPSPEVAQKFVADSEDIQATPKRGPRKFRRNTATRVGHDAFTGK